MDAATITAIAALVTAVGGVLYNLWQRHQQADQQRSDISSTNVDNALAIASHSRQDIEDLRQERADLEKKVADLSAQLEEALTRLAAAEAELKRARALLEQLADLRDKVEYLTSENQHLQQENTRLENELRHWKGRVTSLEERAKKRDSGEEE